MLYTIDTNMCLWQFDLLKNDGLHGSSYTLIEKNIKIQIELSDLLQISELSDVARNNVSANCIMEELRKMTNKYQSATKLLFIYDENLHSHIHRTNRVFNLVLTAETSDVLESNTYLQVSAVNLTLLQNENNKSRLQNENNLFSDLLVAINYNQQKLFSAVG